MAKSLTPCSSSFIHERQTVVPRRNATLVSHHSNSESHLKKQIQLKSSNGHALNAVSLQDGGNSPANEAKDVQILSSNPEDMEPTISITVVGASGDLAKKKIFPALFALFYEGHLPKHFTIFGYARSKMTDEELRDIISRTLTCRIDQRENCSDKVDHFLQRCFYHSCQYDSEEDFLDLKNKLRVKEDNKTSRNT